MEPVRREAAPLTFHVWSAVRAIESTWFAVTLPIVAFPAVDAIVIPLAPKDSVLAVASLPRSVVRGVLLKTSPSTDVSASTIVVRLPFTVEMLNTAISEDPGGLDGFGVVAFDTVDQLDATSQVALAVPSHQ